MKKQDEEVRCKECGERLTEDFERELGMCYPCMLLADRRRAPARQEIMENDR